MTAATFNLVVKVERGEGVGCPDDMIIRDSLIEDVLDGQSFWVPTESGEREYVVTHVEAL